VEIGCVDDDVVESAALRLREDWRVLVDHLPAGWEQQAREKRALLRAREFDGAEALLRTLLIHLAEGCSLRETAVRARLSGLAKVSDVAVMKRLRASEGWLQWMAFELARPRRYFDAPDGEGRFHLRVVDATTVSEPGSTGTDWRLHYVLALKTLQCDHFELTDVHGGETFTRVPIHAGDLILGDRGYDGLDGIHHVLDHQGQVVVRMRINGHSLQTRRGGKFDLLKELSVLKVGDIADWPVRMTASGKKSVGGRVCALRRSELAAALAEKRMRHEVTRKGKPVTAEAVEATKYVFVFTTVEQSVIRASDIMELYRARWQIEMCFKRLKSVMGFGHLPKYDQQSCRAWLYGKLLVALLAERLLDTAHHFSPWGYELGHGAKEPVRVC
jgi:hypothetical protein